MQLWLPAVCWLATIASTETRVEYAHTDFVDARQLSLPWADDRAELDAWCDEHRAAWIERLEAESE